MIVLIYLERKFPYRKGVPFFREGLWVDFMWYSLFQNYILQIVIFEWIIYPLNQKIPWANFHFVSTWHVGWQLLFFFVLHDLYIYWFHRWQHTNKFLWRFHEAHHSNKVVDWIAGSRSHAMEIIINQTIEFAPIVLLGADPVIIPVKAAIDGIWGMYIHSNINVKSGRLQYFINGPEMHLWHHADHQEVFFANYSTKLAIWDWLFGTAYLPQTKPLRYGLFYDFPKDYFLQHIFTIKKICEKDLVKYKFFKFYFSLRPYAINKVKDFFIRLQPCKSYLLRYLKPNK
jgi:sterol desaturase/sphingolipid hydroxylase (fatty acid hydroxylase superfamily)